MRMMREAVGTLVRRLCATSVPAGVLTVLSSGCASQPHPGGECGWCRTASSPTDWAMISVLRNWQTPTTRSWRRRQAARHAIQKQYQSLAWCGGRASLLTAPNELHDFELRAGLYTRGAPRRLTNDGPVQLHGDAVGSDVQEPKQVQHIEVRGHGPGLPIHHDFKRFDGVIYHS